MYLPITKLLLWFLEDQHSLTEQFGDHQKVNFKKSTHVINLSVNLPWNPSLVSSGYGKNPWQCFADVWLPESVIWWVVFALCQVDLIRRLKALASWAVTPMSVYHWIFLITTLFPDWRFIYCDSWKIEKAIKQGTHMGEASGNNVCPCTWQWDHIMMAVLSPKPPVSKSYSVSLACLSLSTSLPHKMSTLKLAWEASSVEHPV